MNRRPTLDELIGADPTGTERQRLQHAHEMLLVAGPPPELSPELEAGPNLGMTLGKRRRSVKPRALALLAAAVLIALVFLGGYAVGNRGGGTTTTANTAAKQIVLEGTSVAPKAEASLEVWHAQAGNWPMTLRAVGLPESPAHSHYEVYLVRDGKPWGACGTFRVQGSSPEVTVTLNAPYSLRKGDTWIVTQPGPNGTEPGQTVLAPLKA